MRLSKLKQLHPIAYQVFCTEVIHQESMDYLIKAIVNDNKINEALYFEESGQDVIIWLEILNNKNFTLLENWFYKPTENKSYRINETVKSWFTVETISDSSDRVICETHKPIEKVKVQTPEKKVKEYLKEALKMPYQEIQTFISLPIPMAKDILNIIKDYKKLKKISLF